MTLVSFVRCDGRDKLGKLGWQPCEHTVSALEPLPDDWELVALPPAEPNGPPRSQHFCKAHVGSDKHLEALRQRSGG